MEFDKIDLTRLVIVTDLKEKINSYTDICNELLECIYKLDNDKEKIKEYKKTLLDFSKNVNEDLNRDFNKFQVFFTGKCKYNYKINFEDLLEKKQGIKSFLYRLEKGLDKIVKCN